MRKREVSLIALICLSLCLIGCSKECETYRGEKYVKCLNCFPRATVIICIPCREHDNVEHCQPYCEECGGRNIVKMTQWEIDERKKKLGYK